MELRLRRFLLSTKRDQTNTAATKADLPSSSSASISSQQPSQSSTIKPISNKSAPTEKTFSLLAIPYDAVDPGTAPIFTSQPVKGNGPIKLQSSRWLSSGEVSTSFQDGRMVLEDIQEGEYIIGGKDKRNFPIRSATASTPPATPATPALSSSQSFADSVFSPKSLRTPTSPWSPTLSEHAEHPLPETKPSAHDGLGITSNSVKCLQPQINHGHTMNARSVSAMRYSRLSTATSPSVQVLDEQNATIAALWKAEYNRLVDIYGQEHIERKMPNLRGGNGTINLNAPVPPRSSERMSGVTLDPLPYPDLEKHNEYQKRDSSASSNLSHDDNSDDSSHGRASLASSCARSSQHTTQTTNTEHDTVVTREDIRKIINQMRTNYIRALDGQQASTPKSTRPVKKKRRAKGRVLVTNQPTRSSLTPVDRQTWHGDGVDGPVPSQKPSSQTRTASNPVTAFGRLSPVEASPIHEEAQPIARPQLQRADSATLGSLIAKSQSDITNTSTEKISLNQKPQTNIAKNKLLPALSIPPKSVHAEAIHLKTGHSLISVQPIAVKPEGNFF